MGIKCPKCQTENPDTQKFCGDCGTRLSLHEDVSISVTKTMISPVAEGSTVAGKYRIIEKLGEGGMGVVYKAEDTRLDRMVALKFLPPELMKDPDAKLRFIREAKAAAALSHPNICTIHEIDEEEGKSFIAMEYIEGENIREKVKKNPLEIPEALDMAIQAAQGLEEAHKRGIIHRDIKSANIMVTGSGQAKVMDFGLAKVSGASLLTKETSTMGTVAYMSPEQAQGQSVDQRTDIWSLGVVLYEILTGQLPFLGDTDRSVMYAIARKLPIPMKKIIPNATPELERVIEKALEKNPADRYQSMGELLEDLGALAEGLKPIRARSRLFRGRVLGIRKPVFLAASALILVLATLGLLALLFGPSRADILDSVAILPIINESGDAGRDYFAKGLTRELNTELYKVAALTVPPAETILAYRNSDKPPKKIAQELGVRALVQGSWLQVGSRHRLIYTLIDPFRKNAVIATDRLEMEGEDIIFLQKEIARAVVAAVKVAVTPEEQALLAQARKVNPEAYDLYLKGYNAYRISYNPTEALGYLERAIEADPDLATAHAIKGMAYWDLGINGVMPEKEAYPKARAAIERALELDENLAVAHSNMGFILAIMDWDFAGAEKSLKRSLALEPGNVDVINNYAIYLRVMGRFEESIEMFTAAREKAPPGFFDILASAYLWAGRLDEGVEIAEKAYRENPSDLQKLWLALAYGLKGRYNESLALINELSASSPMAEELYIDMANIYALSGKREEALTVMEKAKAIYAEKGVEPEFNIACVYAALGEKDKAIALLEKAYEKHAGVLINLRTYPFLKSLHGDPRFQDLVKKVGFPEVQVPSEK